MTGHSVLDTDILVIGSGPGGSVAATKFAEAGRSVLMVEEGEHLPLDATPHFSCEEMLHKYRSAGVGVALGKRKLAWVEGSCVGGGSEVNRGLYHRTPPYVLERWARDYGVVDLSPGEMTQHFEACEAVATVQHMPGKPSESSQALERGATKKGWTAIAAPRLYRYDTADGRGSKQSMSATFVPRFKELGGNLLADVRIQRLRRTNRTWEASGVRTSGAQKTQITIRADTVFVACGAVQTPALLRRSGIRHNVGNSLRFHPMLKIIAEFDHEVNAPGDFDPVHQIKEFEPRFGMGCSIAKPPLLAMLQAARPGNWTSIERDWRRMGIYYVQTSGGRATVRNLPGFASPLVRIHFTPEELSTLADGLRHLADVLLAAGSVRLRPCIAGYPDLDRQTGLAGLPEALEAPDGSLTSVHVFSSCPMGEDRARTATDSFGKVHGTDGLYICDASLLCTPTIANPQGTVMAVAHRNALVALDRKFG
ncbi:GMC family oxidoreductase [Qipengyuania sp. XHP0207]|uniref:GMC family oxidoreductase N-terminal domain-containing protein n=1 Tax=Qipengyuania sp. XHP0207 TaxID=3038078 RepID=UPI00241D1FD4|nr:GMC family oxidoreductase [Qipengyuania sp. XHP0207]MDG5747612.1 GMC family oxidoreductase [Qipengyuania sp. XHP0207]